MSPALSAEAAQQPGERLIRVARCRRNGAPQSLLEGLQSFLQEALPAEIVKVAELDSRDWSLKAVAFMDYVPVYVEARSITITEEAGGRHDFEAAGIWQTFKNDIVKFNELISLAELFLTATGFEIIGPGSSPGLRSFGRPDDGCLVDDFTSDLSEDEGAGDEETDEKVWAQRLQPLLADALGESSCSATREEAARALARQSETRSTAFRLALVRELVGRADQVVNVLLQEQGVGSYSLAEAYPLAAALKFAAFCPHAAETLANSDLPTRLGKVNDTRYLLPREVEHMMRAIHEAKQASWRTLSQHPCQPGDVAFDTISTQLVRNEMHVEVAQLTSASWPQADKGAEDQQERKTNESTAWQSVPGQPRMSSSGGTFTPFGDDEDGTEQLRDTFRLVLQEEAGNDESMHFEDVLRDEGTRRSKMPPLPATDFLRCTF